MLAKEDVNDKKESYNLYKIVFSHSAPRDTEDGLKGYVLAHCEDDVHDYVDKEFNSSCWKDREEDDARFPTDNLESHETFREKTIRLKGTINDEDRDFSDAYYGVSFYGWALVAQDCDPKDFSNIIELGMVKLIEER